MVAMSKAWQEVHVRGARGGQLAQVPHAGRGGVGEGQVLAGVGRGAVRDREVPDVEFLDLRGGGGYGRGLAQLAPAGRRQLGVGEVDGQAVSGVRGQRGGVRVGDEVADHLADGRGPDGDGVPVALAGPAPLAAHRPDPGGVVAVHRDGPAVEFEGDLLGGGRPHRQGGAAVLEDGAEGVVVAYRSSRTPASCTPVAARTAPFAARALATSWPRRAPRTRSRSRGSIV